MAKDGRLDAFYTLSDRNRAKAVVRAAVVRKGKTTCPKGHPYSGANLYVYGDGRRSCRACLNDYKRNKRAEGVKA